MVKSNKKKVRLYRPKKKGSPEELEIADLQSKYKDVSKIKSTNMYKYNYISLNTDG